MAEKTIRLLKADEIECRVGTINEKGLTLLLYKDARVDMKVLDEVYGIGGWQREHEVIGGNLYCKVSIWDRDKKQWISKMDVGTKSRTETEKGEASDSFKRACFSIGIGRELYTAPFIWVPSTKANIQKKEGKFITYDRFKVESISYNEGREIVGLVIKNQEDKLVFKMECKKDEKKQETVSSNQEKSDEVQKENFKAEINKELVRTGVALDKVLERYGLKSIDEMDEEVFKTAMSCLKITKTKAA